MESFAQIAFNLRAANIREDWYARIAACDALLEYAQECADERDERPECIATASGKSNV